MFVKVFSGKDHGGDTSGAARAVIEIRIGPEHGDAGLLILGLPAAAARESGDRIRAALRSAGFTPAPGRATLIFSPVDLIEETRSYELPIALGILAADGTIPAEALARFGIVGGLEPDGRVREVNELLSAVAVRLREEEAEGLLVPLHNRYQPTLIKGIDVYPVRTLREAAEFLMGEREMEPFHGDWTQPVCVVHGEKLVPVRVASEPAPIDYTQSYLEALVKQFPHAVFEFGVPAYYPGKTEIRGDCPACHASHEQWYLRKHSPASPLYFIQRLTYKEMVHDFYGAANQVEAEMAAQDAADPGLYHLICECYADAGDPDAVLDWAERGLRESMARTQESEMRRLDDWVERVPELRRKPRVVYRAAPDWRPPAGGREVQACPRCGQAGFRYFPESLHACYVKGRLRWTDVALCAACGAFRRDTFLDKAHREETGEWRLLEDGFDQALIEMLEFDPAERLRKEQGRRAPPV
ncbi:MAG: hypothetical protein JXR37_03315 [Kiritimatiellae bacterium]|nr:hypothetical protein [Kiritimatiellia bacterium]